MRREKPKVVVRLDRLLRLRQIQLAVVIQQPVQRLQNLTTKVRTKTREVTRLFDSYSKREGFDTRYSY